MTLLVPGNMLYLEITCVITPVIEIDIALLTVYFVITRCFVIARLLIRNCPLLKGISFNTNCLLVRCD